MKTPCVKQNSCGRRLPSEQAPLLDDDCADEGADDTTLGGRQSCNDRNDTQSRLSYTSRSDSFGPSALFLCLVLVNPFDPHAEPELPIDSSLFEGYQTFEHIYVAGRAANGGGVASGGGDGDNNNDDDDDDSVSAQLLPEHMRTGLKDEDFLKESSLTSHHLPHVIINTAAATSTTAGHPITADAGKASANVNEHISDDFAPNKFQKVIEMILRLQKRELDVFPEDMLVEADFSECGNANYFKGWKLDRSKLLTSPDQDEMYIKVHARRRVLCKFAEKSSIPLLTHDFSFGGGAAMPYSQKLENELTRSVKKYFRTFEPDSKDYAGSNAVKGFDIHPQHKLRLLVRYLREQWRFGGCGLQLNEMKRKKVLILNYFALHNKSYIQAHGLDTWSSLNICNVAKSLLSDKTAALSCYFGEQVGLYFQWLREYIIVLIVLGVIGLFLGASTQIFGHTALTNASFAIVCVSWAFYWNLHWNRKESLFAIDNCQEEQLDQEPVRDEFRVSAMETIECSHLYRMTFKYPLSLQITPEGSFLNLYFSNAKRLMIRYMFSYPIVFILTGAMVTVLTLINYWRFENNDDERISYAASVLTVVAGQVFGVLFELIVGLLNWAENNRTDADEDNERILKSFFFYFFSFYYSLFVICLWPVDGPSYTRLQQLRAQMLIICIAKPILATTSGLAVPWLMCSLRKRYDIAGGFCRTIGSLICCKSVRKMMEEKEIDPDDEGTQMWMEAQLQPYDSTAKDYLRVTLQFGYMAMFAATFPWAAPAALIYNIIDRRADAVRLLHYCQRPMAKPSANIGPWKKIFMVITAFAVVTNCYLICVLSPVYEKIGLGDKTSDSEFKWMSYIAVQYGLIFIAFAMSAVIPPIPVASHKLRLKRFLLTNPSIRQRFYDRNKAEALAAITRELAADEEEVAAAAEERHHADEDEDEDDATSVGVPNRTVSFQKIISTTTHDGGNGNEHAVPPSIADRSSPPTLLNRRAVKAGNEM